MVGALKDYGRTHAFDEIVAFTGNGNKAAGGLYEKTGAGRPAADDVVFEYDFNR